MILVKYWSVKVVSGQVSFQNLFQYATSAARVCKQAFSFQIKALLSGVCRKRSVLNSEVDRNRRFSLSK